MKTYKVLETHIGDDPHNAYVPGDPKYGTRTMAATDAKALLELGLLAEIEEEAPAERPVEPAPAPAADPDPAAAPEPEPEQAPVAPTTSRKSSAKAH